MITYYCLSYSWCHWSSILLLMAFLPYVFPSNGCTIIIRSRIFLVTTSKIIWLIYGIKMSLNYVKIYHLKIIQCIRSSYHIIFNALKTSMSRGVQFLFIFSIFLIFSPGLLQLHWKIKNVGEHYNPLHITHIFNYKRWTFFLNRI